MTRTHFSLALVATLAACGDGQPLFDTETPVTTDEASEAVTDAALEDIQSGSDGRSDSLQDLDEILDAGTNAPPLLGELAERGDIVRIEALDGSGGITSSFAFNGDDDTFTVDGLGFDGLNVYQRSANIPQLGSIAVYEADQVVLDSLTEQPIDQIVPYIALFDRSEVLVDEDGAMTLAADGTPRTSFTVVRTGGYQGFGFGGYAYQRAGSFTLQETGQARFTGDYAGVRVYERLIDHEITSGQVIVDIDFDDFNTTEAVKGIIFDREARKADGTVVASSTNPDERLITAGDLQLPNLNFTVRAFGTAIANDGEISGNIGNTRIDDQGNLLDYEDGQYFGIIAGDLTDRNDGGEIVGVIKVESEDNRGDGIIVQETGGFIATR